MSEIPNDNIQHLLKQVVDHFTIEDRAVRERQIRMWRKLKLYWNNFQRVYYSETAHDWRIPDNMQLGADQSSYYDKPVNIFRAYLESIFAALSINIPAINCIPDDADNSLDLSTAKAGDKIYELVSKHNDSNLLWLHLLFIYGTEGLVAVHNYVEENEKYGTYEVPEFKEEEIDKLSKTCSNCGNPIEEEEYEDDTFDPDNDTVAARQLLGKSNFCATCMSEVIPQITNEKVKISRQVGITKKPKSRQRIEAHGGLYVKVPNYCSKQEDIPYLIYSYETHYSNAIEKYPHLSKLGNEKGRPIPGTGGIYEPYERWGRLNPQYYGEYPLNTVTIRNCWLRCSAFNILSKEDAEKLKKKYPDGCKVIFVNELFAYACNEALDDHWTLSYNPLSDYLHHDPLGLLLVSLQDITNDLISLTLQTIEHGIPQTFVDPAVVNLAEYSQQEIAPGALVPTKQSAGKRIADGFYEVKTATLSGEVLPFGDKVQQLAQLTSGALPSLFGGSNTGGGDTAAEYNMSRAQALQRLQTPWKIFCALWKGVFGKVIPSFIEEMVGDEKFVKQDEAGNFINVFIRKAETQGKIGSIELESAENLPITWMQKKDVIMSLLSAGNPEILAMLGSPQNLPLLKQAIGLDDFYVPGEDDRQKAHEEINILVNSAPLDEITPSVPVDSLLDDHKVEAEVFRAWLVSDAGRLCKIENPLGYRNVLLHMQGHVMVLQEQMQAQMMMEQQPEKQPGEKNKPAAKATGAQSNGPGNSGN